MVKIEKIKAQIYGCNPSAKLSNELSFINLFKQ